MNGNPSHGIPKSLEQVVTPTLSNARQYECHGSSKIIIINGYSVTK